VVTEYFTRKVSWGAEKYSSGAEETRLGTFDGSQGTFKEHSGNIQGTLGNIEAWDLSGEEGRGALMGREEGRREGRGSIRRSSIIGDDPNRRSRYREMSRT